MQRVSSLCTQTISNQGQKISANPKRAVSDFSEFLTHDHTVFSALKTTLLG